jgi:hypothetical protein
MELIRQVRVLAVDALTFQGELVQVTSGMPVDDTTWSRWVEGRRRT